MSTWTPAASANPCHCGFELYLPIAQTETSILGLYSDARFPGRCILMLKDHQEELQDLSLQVIADFMADAKQVIGALREVSTAPRVNFAILGNRWPHLHAHLVPRFPKWEERPNSSPWDDPRAQHPLPDAYRDTVIEQIQNALTAPHSADQT